MEIQKNQPYKPQQALQPLNNKTANTLEAQKLEARKLADNQQQTKAASTATASKPAEPIALNISKEGQALAAGGTQKTAEAPAADANKISYAGAVANGQGNIKTQLDNLQKKLTDNQANNTASPRVNSLFR